jgi:hypothetical protein
MDLTPEQQGLKAKITTGAIVTGIIVALVVALLVFWLAANTGEIWRWVLAVVAGAGLGLLTYRLRYNAGVAKAVCPKCGTAFGIREVERREAVIGIEEKRKITPARAASKTDRGTNKVATWTEERVEVTVVDECFKCHNRTERKWQTSRDKDKKEEEVPA